MSSDKYVFVSHNDHQTVFCAVGPYCKEYGYGHPVWTLYNDGSWSRLYKGEYYRSGPNKICKPRCEYSLNDIADWCYGKTCPLVHLADIWEELIKQNPSLKNYLRKGV